MSLHMQICADDLYGGTNEKDRKLSVYSYLFPSDKVLQTQRSSYKQQTPNKHQDQN